MNHSNLPFFKSFLNISQVDVGLFYKDDVIFNQIHDALKRMGDSFIRRIMHHSKNGRLREEFTRDKGLERGAQDLTWSYTAIMTAALARKKLYL